MAVSPLILQASVHLLTVVAFVVRVAHGETMAGQFEIDTLRPLTIHAAPQKGIRATVPD
jgi:hypothetical protein